MVEYLKTPPSRAALAGLIARMGVPVRAVLREKEDLARARARDPALGDDALLDAMTAHPILIERPIVVTPKGVRLCRPSEAVLELLRSRPFRKEDGKMLVDAAGDRDSLHRCGCSRAAACIVPVALDLLGGTRRRILAMRCSATRSGDRRDPLRCCPHADR